MSDPTEAPKVVFLEGAEDVDPEDEYNRLVEEATLVESELTLPRGYLSVSQVSMYMRCGLQYAFRYVDDLIRAPGLALVEGTAIHRAVEVGLREKMESGTPAPLDVMLDAWRDKWAEASKDVEDWGDDGKYAAAREVERRATSFVRTYHTDHIPTIRPESVENRFWTTVGENRIPVLGFIDLIDAFKHRTVVDHKVVKSAKSQADADSDLQLTLYSKVSGTNEVGFDCFVKTKTPKVKSVRSKRTPTDHVWMERVFDHVAQAINDGVFLPADPTSWSCSPKFCGYYHMCRGRKR